MLGVLEEAIEIWFDAPKADMLPNVSRVDVSSTADELLKSGKINATELVVSVVVDMVDRSKMSSGRSLEPLPLVLELWSVGLSVAETGISCDVSLILEENSEDKTGRDGLDTLIYEEAESELDEWIDSE